MKATYEETWNRREIKDCPDLLHLGRGQVLPSTTLQVHYRSKYRELISYSNAAFYGGRLSIPAQHPDTEIKRACPIEVVRVNGTYENQTNPAEAERVVEMLANIWSAPPAQRPTIGVVTFNRKQADLVERTIEQRALTDADFLRAYEREKQRTSQSGEDIGFFVRNVENVQGDERDFILFSTTFGYDRLQTFRRNFGVLGQSGGERRLNVAITRAKEKIIVVTSMVEAMSEAPARGRAPVKASDYLWGYLDYALKLSAGNLEEARHTTARLVGADPAKKSHIAQKDGFTSSVAAYISQEFNLRPMVSNQDDAFGLDLAIEDPRTGLFSIGIECDAPCHDLLRQARAREIWRRAVLSRAIPSVHRVESYAWYHRPVEERERLRAAIEAALN